jgi:hypothetical protein
MFFGVAFVSFKVPGIVVKKKIANVEKTAWAKHSSDFL